MIRPFEKKDTDSVLEIWLNASVISHDFIPQSYWLEKINDMRDIYLPQSNSYVIEENNFVVGFISLVENYIAAIFVHPISQGKGFGKKLLQHAKELYPELILNVYSKNKKSIAFYISQDFLIKNEQIEENTGELETVMEYKKT
nr:N-acetyltransferase [uncultured Flavobacterium sp.]